MPYNGGQTGRDYSHLHPGNSSVHSAAALPLTFQPTSQLSGTRFAAYYSDSPLFSYPISEHSSMSLRDCQEQQTHQQPIPKLHLMKTGIRLC